MGEQTATRYFPVLRSYGERSGIPCPVSVPWAWIEMCEKQALKNHSQTLQRLSERGGLSASELRAVIEGRDFNYGCNYQEDCAWLAQWIEKKEGHEELKLKYEALWARCKIVLYGPHAYGDYPIEHNPSAEKHAREMIEAQLVQK